jgi:hypothetical protein
MGDLVRVVNSMSGSAAPLDGNEQTASNANGTATTPNHEAADSMINEPEPDPPLFYDVRYAVVLHSESPEIILVRRLVLSRCYLCIDSAQGLMSITGCC